MKTDTDGLLRESRDRGSAFRDLVDRLAGGVRHVKTHHPAVADDLAEAAAAICMLWQQVEEGDARLAELARDVGELTEMMRELRRQSFGVSAAGTGRFSEQGVVANAGDAPRPARPQPAPMESDP